MLTIQGLQFAYDKQVLRGIDLQVGPGEQVFILGPSGCGKSTLLQCVAGLQPDGGVITWDGELLGPPHTRRLGMLFQEPALFPHLNVWRNVAFGLKYRGMKRPQWREEALHWLQMVGLGDRAESQVDQLSGGQRQRVALARTLAAKPRAVLLDEPLSALDADLRTRLGQTIRDALVEADTAGIWVTHDEAEAARLGDRVFRLVEGQLEPL